MPESPNFSAIAYRPDIDGLRALAVIFVVLYHAFPESFACGFIGVDIFFVISGYLIGWIIMRDVDKGQFSFCHFYERRIRRIFPSLLTVLVVTLILGWFALLPEEYGALGKHVAGGAAFIDNFLLWFEAGYFDVESRAKPLLHLWSLGIEEQFYLIVPLGLWFCANKKLNFSLVLAYICTFSFLGNLYLYYDNNIADFYSPLARFWELFIGCLLASVMRQTTARKKYLFMDRLLVKILAIRSKINDGRHLSFCLAVIGVALLLLSFITATHEFSWPGWKACFPTGAAVALIAAGPLNVLSKYALCNRYAVYLGKISYPLYLWHWPLLAFSHILQLPERENNTLGNIVLMAFSCLLAVVTYHTVETLLRFKIRSRLVPVGLAVAMGGVCLLGIVTYTSDGFKNRVYMKAQIEEMERIDSLQKLYTKNGLKIFPDWEELSDINLCRLQADLESIDTIIIGDSHADHLFMGFTLSETAHRFGVFPASGAAPYIDVMSFTRQGAEFRKHGCTLINRAYDVAKAYDNIKNVILSHRPYCSYVDIIDVQHPELEDKDRILENAMRRSFTQLAKCHKNIVIILDNPASPIHPRNCKARPYDIFTNKLLCRFSRREALEDDKARNWYNSILKKVIKDFEGIVLVDLENVFCDEEFCYLAQGGKILYKDQDHLSYYGAQIAAKQILPYLR